MAKKIFSLLVVFILSCELRADSSCPGSWSVHRNRKCVKLFNETVTRAEAAKRCAEEGAGLLTINSKEEEDFISDLAFGHNYKSIWLDGYYNSTLDGFVASDGRIVTYFRSSCFHTGFGCLIFRIYDWHQDANCPRWCDGTNHYACEKTVVGNWSEANSTEFEAEVLRGFTLKCPKGWTLWTDNCYWFSIDEQQRMKSQMGCLLMGSEEVSIVSEAEEDFLVAEVARKGHGSNPSFWLGVDCEPGTRCEWSDASYFNYQNWDVAPTANETRPLFAYFAMDTRKWTFVYSDSTYKYISVCKRKARRVRQIPTVRTRMTSLRTPTTTQGPSLPPPKTEVDHIPEPPRKKGSAVVWFILAVIAFTVGLATVAWYVKKRNMTSNKFDVRRLTNHEVFFDTTHPL